MKQKLLTCFLWGCLACNAVQAQVSDTTLQGFSPFPIGAAVSASLLKNNAQYRALVQREYNSITPENAMKFAIIHPSQNTYNWTDADTIVNFAVQGGKRIHGHTLIWYNSLPNWVTNFSGDSAAWEVLMQNHITTVVSHYKGVLTSWDVVNEAFNDDGTLRNSVWMQHLGAGYIARAFQYAHQADTAALLFYNDYGHEYASAKLLAIYNLLKSLRDDGVPVHGAGLQMHINKNTNNSTTAASNNSISRAIDSMANLGLLVHIAELDVAMNPENNQSLMYNTTIAAQQFAKYKYVAQKVRSLPASQVYGITTWNVTDGDSWIPPTYSRPDFPLPFNASYQKKYTYQGFKDGLTTQFPYTVSSVQKLSGTYTDLGTTGTIITTGFTGNPVGYDNDNTAVQDIGFTFRYDGSDYTSFVMNSNGYIKMGSATPYANNVYYTGINGSSNGVITTPDIDLIYAYNHDLKSNSTNTSEYRVYTSGTAGSRVCTIQYKNFADAYQYNNINFQIKLYEGMNVIEFVYGTWTANTLAASITTAAVGIKGAIPGQALNVFKTSGTAWSAAFSSNYSGKIGDYVPAVALFNTRNDLLPVSGTTFRFIPDAAQILPMQLLSFTATQSKAGNLLHWQTACEDNVKSYTVEKSFTNRVFTPIVTLSATGNGSAGTTRYTYTDAATTGRVFYRIVQDNVDGKQACSPIVMLNNTATATLTVLSNPFQNVLNVQMNSLQEEQLIIYLVNSAGTVVKQQVWNMQPGINATEVAQAATLPAGIYWLRVTGSSSTFIQKLIKQ